MSRPSSLFLDILDRHVFNELSTTHKEELIEKITAAFNEGREVFNITESYNFRLNWHIQVGNKHNAPYSTGCGCRYCQIRHEYAKLKLNLHRKSKSFEMFLCYDYYSSKLSKTDLQLIQLHTEERVSQIEKIKEVRQKLLEVKNNLKRLGIEI